MSESGKKNENVIAEVKVYQDGKMCRGESGLILKRQSGRILIKFNDGFGGVVIQWFRRRSRRGVYECLDYNYWYFTY